jgi:hypothetical protein
MDKEKTKTNASITFSGNSISDMKHQIICEVLEWDWEQDDIVWFGLIRGGIIFLESQESDDVKLRFDVCKLAEDAINEDEFACEHAEKELLSLLERTKAALNKIDNHRNKKEGE